MKKKFYLLFTLLFFSTYAIAQLSYSDDFELYNDGDKLGAVSSAWTTWSGTTGGAEDADVVEGVAASGEKSIYFLGTGANGGPQDVVLPFGAQYTTGQFNYSMNILIEEGTGAYFNFQGQTTVGQDWVTQVWFENDGLIRIEGSTNGQQEAGASYNYGEWINISYDINLSANIWSISIDGECVGSWSNVTNSVASLDLFPLNGHSFWVDDVAFSYSPDADIPMLDLAIGNVDLRPAGITGQEKSVSGTVVNNAMNEITSFDVTISDGATSETESYSGLSLANGAEYGFQFDMPYVIKEGQTEVSVTISNINGLANDDEPCNDATRVVVTGVTPAPGKKVVAEEGTGTWCTWCPRGHVFMDMMHEEYGEDYFVGIAVHNNDPMMVPEHNAGMAFTSYPSLKLDRAETMDPSQMEVPFLNRLTIPPLATLTNGATFDPTTDELTVSVTANFLQDVAGDYRLSVIIVEEGVTGTDQGYAQVNAYSGGNNGPMGGYENLPSPVPASQMVYNDVSRAVLGGFDGTENSLPESASAGESHAYIFNMVVPEEFDLSNLKIIGVLIAPDGTIDNGEETTLEAAIDNGLAVSTEEIITNASVETFPNPFNDELNITMDLEETVNVSTRLFNVAGELIATQEFGTLSGKNTISMNTNTLSEGMYILNIVLDNQIVVKKVTLVK